MATTGKIAWYDGELVPVEEIRVSPLAHGLHYGTGIFEGIRCYAQPSGAGGVFRLREHMERLVFSARVVGIEMGPSVDALCAAAMDVLRANAMKAAYVRPIVFLGEGALGVAGGDNPVHTVIAALDWGTYLGKAALEEGITVAITGHERPTHNSAPLRAKVTGGYVGSFIAKRKALAMGVSEALMLDRDGYLVEGTGENLFVVKEGALVTPPDDSPILLGITRASVLTLAGDLGIPVRFSRPARSDLYGADEAFLTGTAAELTPIRAVDARPLVHARGPITARLQEAYLDTVHGRGPRSKEWITPVGTGR